MLKWGVCWTEGFPVWNWGIYCVELRDLGYWKGVVHVWNRCVELRRSVWNWGVLLQRHKYGQVSPKSVLLISQIVIFVVFNFLDKSAINSTKFNFFQDYLCEMDSKKNLSQLQLSPISKIFVESAFFIRSWLNCDKIMIFVEFNFLDYSAINLAKFKFC